MRAANAGGHLAQAQVAVRLRHRKRRADGPDSATLAKNFTYPTVSKPGTTRA